MDAPSTTGDEPIRIAPTVERCGANRRLTREWAWIAAPPHVRRFVEGTFAEVVAELAAHGYAFSIEPAEREVSPFDWYFAGT